MKKNNFYEIPLSLGPKRNSLFGILSVPDLSNRVKECFVFISAGMIYRVGPHYLYVKLARRFREEGYYSFRFDQNGQGDSSGSFKDNYLKNHYNNIQNGKFVQDTLVAIQDLNKKYKFKRIHLIGLCGGAVTAFLAGNHNSTISSIISIGLDVTFDSIDKNTERYSDEFASFIIKGYIKKIFNKESWLNLFNGRTDYSLILSAIKSKFKPHLPGQKNKDNFHPDFNYPLYKEFIRFINNDQKVLFIFGEYDKYWMEYKKEFFEKIFPLGDERDNNYIHKIIEKGNHNLALPEWQKETAQHVLSFIQNLDSKDEYNEKDFIIKKLKEEEFISFKEEWNALLDKSELESFFLRWEWMYSFWKNINGPDKELMILLCYDGSNLLAIAPFYLYKEKIFGFNTWKVGFLGNRVSGDFKDIICINELRSKVCRLFLPELKKNISSKKFFYEFSDALPDSCIYKYFTKLSKDKSQSIFIKEKEICPRAVLPTTFEDYLNSLSSNTRYNYKRRYKQLKSKFSEPILKNNNIATMENLDMLFDLHEKRWDLHTNKNSTFNNVFRKEFNKSLIELMRNQDGIIFSNLLIGDEVASILYIFRRKDNYYFYQNGWNPKYSKYSIGMVHLIMFIEYAIKNKAKTFDFLRGEESYKFKLSTEIRKTYSLYAASKYSKNNILLTLKRSKNIIR